MKFAVSFLALIALAASSFAQADKAYSKSVHQLTSKASLLQEFGEPQQTTVRENYEKCYFASNDYRLEVLLKDDAIIDYSYTQRNSQNRLASGIDITSYSAMRGQHIDVLVDAIGYPVEIAATPTSEIWTHKTDTEQLIVRVNPKDYTIMEVVWVPKG